jgi:hypothetical protein
MIPYGEIFLDNNKGVLIGGRNRAEAWDPSPPVLAINVKRRHSKGRQAMAQALIYPDPEAASLCLIRSENSAGFQNAWPMARTPPQAPPPPPGPAVPWVMQELTRAIGARPEKLGLVGL